MVVAVRDVLVGESEVIYTVSPRVKAGSGSCLGWYVLKVNVLSSAGRLKSGSEGRL